MDKWTMVLQKEHPAQFTELVSYLKKYDITMLAQDNVYIGISQKNNLKVLGLTKSKKHKQAVYLLPLKYLSENLRNWLHTLPYQSAMISMPKKTIPVYDEYFSACSKLGLTDPDELFEILYERSDDLESKDAGFTSRHNAFMATSRDDHGLYLLCKYNDIYIVHHTGEMIHGFADDYLDDLQVFTKYAKAKKYFDNLEPDCLYYKDSIDLLEKAVEESGYSVDCEAHQMFFGYGLSISYFGLQIFEKYIEGSDYYKDAEIIVDEIKRLEAFQKQLAAMGVHLCNMYKLPREWNNNQRYYQAQLRYKDKDFEVTAHIPSRHQNIHDRKLLDYLEKPILEMAAILNTPNT